MQPSQKSLQTCFVQTAEWFTRHQKTIGIALLTIGAIGALIGLALISFGSEALSRSRDLLDLSFSGKVDRFTSDMLRYGSALLNRYGVRYIKLGFLVSGLSLIPVLTGLLLINRAQKRETNSENQSEIALRQRSWIAQNSTKLIVALFLVAIVGTILLGVGYNRMMVGNGLKRFFPDPCTGWGTEGTILTYTGICTLSALTLALIAKGLYELHHRHRGPVSSPQEIAI